MTRHLIISGIVQGVGYRASFQMQAHALQLSGWVRNRRDGTVEALVAGAPDKLAAIIDWARHGPPGARVDHIAVTETADTPAKSGVFDMLPTV